MRCRRFVRSGLAVHDRVARVRDALVRPVPAIHRVVALDPIGDVDVVVAVAGSDGVVPGVPDQVIDPDPTGYLVVPRTPIADQGPTEGTGDHVVPGVSEDLVVAAVGNTGQVSRPPVQHVPTAA